MSFWASAFPPEVFRPALGREREVIELVPAGVPARHEAVHQFREALAVVTFEIVGHLMDKDVLQAIRVFLGELGVEPNMPRLAITGPPLGFHAPNAPSWNGQLKLRLPFGDERWKSLAKLFPVPTVK